MLTHQWIERSHSKCLPYDAGLSIDFLWTVTVPLSKPSKVQPAHLRTLIIIRAELRSKKRSALHRWNSARAVMQPGIPTAAPLSTPSRRFTSDAQVSGSKPLANSDAGRDCFSTKPCPGAVRRVRDCSHMCTDSLHSHSGPAERKAFCALYHSTDVVAVSQPCGILTAPPSSVAVVRRSDPLHPGLINADVQLELRSDRVHLAQLLWIARGIWHVPN